MSYREDDHWSRLSTPTTHSCAIRSPSILQSPVSSKDAGLPFQFESPIHLASKYRNWTPDQLAAYIKLLPTFGYKASNRFPPLDVHQLAAWVIDERLAGRAFLDLGQEDIEELSIANEWKDILLYVWGDLHQTPTYEGEHPMESIRDPLFWREQTPQPSARQREKAPYESPPKVGTALPLQSSPDSYIFSFAHSPLVRSEHSGSDSPIHSAGSNLNPLSLAGLQVAATPMRSVIVTAPPPPYQALAPSISPVSTGSALESIDARLSENSAEKADKKSTHGSAHAPTPLKAERAFPLVEEPSELDLAASCNRMAEDSLVKRADSVTTDHTVDTSVVSSPSLDGNATWEQDDNTGPPFGLTPSVEPIKRVLYPSPTAGGLSLTSSLVHASALERTLTPAPSHLLASNLADADSLSTVSDREIPESHHDNDGRTDVLENMLDRSAIGDDAESFVRDSPTPTSTWPSTTEAAARAEHPFAMRVDTERIEAILQTSLQQISRLTERIEGLEDRVVEMELTVNNIPNLGGKTDRIVLSTCAGQVERSPVQRPPMYLRAGAILVGMGIAMGASHLARRGAI